MDQVGVTKPTRAWAPAPHGTCSPPKRGNHKKGGGSLGGQVLSLPPLLWSPVNIPGGGQAGPPPSLPLYKVRGGHVGQPLNLSRPPPLLPPSPSCAQAKSCQWSYLPWPLPSLRCWHLYPIYICTTLATSRRRRQCCVARVHNSEASLVAVLIRLDRRGNDYIDRVNYDFA
jgi:hypothetical protein